MTKAHVLEQLREQIAAIESSNGNDALPHAFEKPLYTASSNDRRLRRKSKSSKFGTSENDDLQHFAGKAPDVDLTSEDCIAGHRKICALEVTKNDTQADELYSNKDLRPSELSHDEQYHMMMRKIERLITRREYASQELRKRFIREGYHEAPIEEALQRSRECGLVSDERYAEVLVRSRLSQGKGKAGITRELAALKIEYSSILAVCEMLDDYSEENERNRAMELLISRPPKSKNLRESAFRKLISKGFSSEIASHVARVWVESLRK